MEIFINGMFEKTTIPERLIDVSNYMDDYIYGDRRFSLFGVKVYCWVEKRDEIAEVFINSFKWHWIRARKKVVREYGSCVQDEENYWPCQISLTDYGFFISVKKLILKYAWGDYYESDMMGNKALESSLKKMRKQFPEIKYYGCIAECYSDVHGGDYIEWYPEYNMSEEDKDYDFVGEYLDHALSDSSFLSELLDSEYEDYEELIDFFIRFIGPLKKDTLGNALNEFYAEMKDSDAKKLSDHVKEIMNADITHEDILRECYLKRNNNEIQDYFVELDTAIEMTVLAEKLKYINIKKQKGVISLQEAFEKVIMTAEKGNIDAKFVAGRYLVAGENKKDRNRGIQWIREAADAGLEEAIKCINKHPDVFSEG